MSGMVYLDIWERCSAVLYLSMFAGIV